MTITNTRLDETQYAYVRWAAAEQDAEERCIHRNREFYEGEQGIALTSRQKEYLGDIAADLDDEALANICKRAVQIPLERLAVTGITAATGGEAYAAMASQWWKANQMDAWQYEVHQNALRDETAVIVMGWDGTKPTMTVNELYDGQEGQVRLHYDNDTGALLYASKRFVVRDPMKPGATGKARLTLYYADKIERYQESRADASGWELLPVAQIGDPSITENPQPWTENRQAGGVPLGIPVIPFDNPNGSELDDVIMPQKAMNKSLADLLSAQDLHGFPILELKGYKAVPNAAPLKISPGEAVGVPENGGASRIPPADLTPMFNSGVMGWLQILTIVKGWPLYLWTHGEAPSGESIKSMESSLIAQVKRKQQAFGDSWKQAMDQGRRILRAYTGQQLAGDIDIQWAAPETRNDKSEAETAQIKITAGQLPLTWAWRELGYTEEQIVEMQAEKEQEIARQVTQSVLQALRAQQTFGANGAQPVGQMSAEMSGQPLDNRPQGE